MSKSERYVSNRRGWRGGKGSLNHQAQCIIESMQAHPGRDLNHYEPIPADVRAIIVEKLGAAKKTEKTQPLDDEALANIATAIVEETIRRGGDPMKALAPYSDAVKELVRRNLAKARENKLRSMCKQRETARFAELRA